jgi:hypothetical protein
MPRLLDLQSRPASAKGEWWSVGALLLRAEDHTFLGYHLEVTLRKSLLGGMLA